MSERGCMVGVSGSVEGRVHFVRVVLGSQEGLISKTAVIVLSRDKRKLFRIKDLKMGTDTIFFYSAILGKSAPENKKAKKTDFFIHT